MTIKNSKVKITLIATLLIIALFGIAAVGFLLYISPPKDDIEIFDYPPEFFCNTEENRIDYQTDGKCAAYASAYLLRHIYLADSIAGNANAADSRYNRIMTTKEFKAVWKNETILPDNIYIVVKNRTDNL